MRHSADILIVTVNSNEAKAVLDAFKAVTNQSATVFNTGNHTYHDLGTVNDQHLVMVQSEMGSGGLGSSLQTVAEAVAALKPAAVIMVGVGFGLKPDKQEIGQVLVASRTMNYEPQRVGLKDGKEESIPRGTRADVSTKLLNHFRAAEVKGDKADPKVSVGLIISGEKLVDNPEFLKKLQASEPEAIGGEMEGSGLYAACQMAKVDWILVKGICDWGDGNKDNPNKDNDQQLAARNSACFVVKALKLGKLIEPKQQHESSAEAGATNVHQENVQAGRVVAGHDVEYTETTHHHYSTTDFSELDALIKGFQKDCEGDTAPKGLIDDLLHLSTAKQNEKVIGLEAKLKAAGRDDAFVTHGQEMKELFAKKLTKHTFSESAQKVYLYLLNEVASHFQFAVLPHIKAGESPAVVDKLIESEVIEPVQKKLGPHKFVLDLYAREISGMLFFLTGNCHLLWAKQC